MLLRTDEGRALEVPNLDFVAQKDRSAGSSATAIAQHHRFTRAEQRADREHREIRQRYVKRRSDGACGRNASEQAFGLEKMFESRRRAEVLIPGEVVDARFALQLNEAHATRISRSPKIGRS